MNYLILIIVYVDVACYSFVFTLAYFLMFIEYFACSLSVNWIRYYRELFVYNK